MSFESMVPSSHLILRPCTSPPTFNLSQSQGLFQWVGSSYQLAKAKASASASVLPMNIQCWFPLGLTGLVSLQSEELSRVFSSTTGDFNMEQSLGDHWALEIAERCHSNLLLIVYFKLGIVTIYKGAFPFLQRLMVWSQALPESCLWFWNFRSLWYPKHFWEFIFIPVCPTFLCLIHEPDSFQSLSLDEVDSLDLPLNAFHWFWRSVISSGFCIYPFLCWSEKRSL